MCTTLDSRIRTSFVFSHISRSNASCKSCFRRSCWMQASRSKGAMSRSSDRRQSAKGHFTSLSLTALVRAAAPAAVGLPATNEERLALQSAHDAPIYQSALVSYSLRAWASSRSLHSDTERGFILRLSPKFRRMGGQANQFGSYSGLRRLLEYAGRWESVYPYDFSLLFHFCFLVYSHLLTP